MGYLLIPGLAPCHINKLNKVIKWLSKGMKGGSETAASCAPVSLLLPAPFSVILFCGMSGKGESRSQAVLVLAVCREHMCRELVLAAPCHLGFTTNPPLLVARCLPLQGAQNQASRTGRCFTTSNGEAFGEGKLVPTLV